MFIIIVFKLAGDKVVCCLFCLSHVISHGMWLFASERVDDFSFSIVEVHFVFS